LFFREIHGAEPASVDAPRQLAGFRRTGLFLARRTALLGLGPAGTRLVTTRFLTTRLVTARFIATRLVTAHFLTARFITARFITARFITARFITARFITAHLFTTRLITARLITARLITARLITAHLFTTHLFTTRLVATRAMVAVPAMTFVVARPAGWWRRQLARLLNAPQRAPQFVDFALVGQLLPLRQFDQLEYFVQLVQRMPQRIRDFGGESDRLGYGRGFSGPEIRLPGPGLWFRPARLGLWPQGGLLLNGLRFPLRRMISFGRRFGFGFEFGFMTGPGGNVRRGVVVRSWLGESGGHLLGLGLGLGRLKRFFGMRLAEVAGSVALRFGSGIRGGTGLGRFGRQGQFFGGCFGFFVRGARSTSPATASAASAAPAAGTSAGAAGRGGHV
jgi:hypothetical protein